MRRKIDPRHALPAQSALLLTGVVEGPLGNTDRKQQLVPQNLLRLEAV